MVSGLTRETCGCCAPTLTTRTAAATGHTAVEVRFLIMREILALERHRYGDSCPIMRLTTAGLAMLCSRPPEAEMVKRAFAAIALACVCSVVTEARVVRIEIVKVERIDPPGSGPQSGTPPYERLSGKFYGELDPADPKNALITDIQL